MKRIHLHLLFLVPTAAWVFAAIPALADHTRQHTVVDGTEIYLGVLPAEMIRGHPKGQPENGMHGGIPTGTGYHHVVIALFDAKTGKRLTDAEVKASVTELGLAGQEKRLEPMTVAGAATYGNYFKMPAPGPYRIQVQVRRPGSPHAIEAKFEYRHP